MMTSPVVDEIMELYRTQGDRSYGEHVSEREHALQCAAFAELRHETPAIVLAALLHDIGHLLHNLGENVADTGVDARHETLGANWLTPHFPPSIVEPIRLHVASKRYLCGASPEYLDGLSAASRQSLQLQGGPMSAEEQVSFEKHPHFAAGISVRRYDDMGKVPGMATASFETHLDLIQSFVTKR